MDNGFFNGELPVKQSNYIPILSDVFVKLTQMAQQDAQMLLTFVLVDQLSGENTAINPVLSCDNAQNQVKAACIGNTEWFLGQYKLMRTIGLYVMVPLFFVMVIQSLLKGSLFALLRGSLIMFPVAVIGTAVIIVFMQMFLNITDDLCNYIVNRSTVGLTVDSCTASDGSVVTSTTCGLKNSLADRSIGSSGLFVAMVWLFILIVSTIAIYLELVGREIGVYMMTLMLPLVMAGLIWPRSVNIAKKTLQYEMALIISKVFLTAALCLGMGAYAHTNASKCTSFTDQATGQQSAVECGAAGPNVVTNPEGAGEQVETTQATNDDWQALASGTLIILMAAFSAHKVVTLSPAAMAGTIQVWNKGALASRGQVISIIGQRMLQYQGWRAKNRKPGTNFNTGPKTPQGPAGPSTPLAPRPPDAMGRGLYKSNNNDTGEKGKTQGPPDPNKPPSNDGDPDQSKVKNKNAEKLEKFAGSIEKWADRAENVPSTGFGRGLATAGRLGHALGQTKRIYEECQSREAGRSKGKLDRLRLGDTMNNEYSENAQRLQAEREAAVQNRR
jgi:hypothetical protein